MTVTRLRKARVKEASLFAACLVTGALSLACVAPDIVGGAGSAAATRGIASAAAEAQNAQGSHAIDVDVTSHGVQEGATPLRVHVKGISDDGTPVDVNEDVDGVRNAFIPSGTYSVVIVPATNPDGSKVGERLNSEHTIRVTDDNSPRLPVVVSPMDTSAPTEAEV